MHIIRKITSLYEDNVDRNFFFLFLFLIFIGFVRNLLELMFYWKTKEMYGFSLSIAGLFNTVTYVFLMIIAEGYIINFLLGGNNKKLKELIKKGVWLLFGLFILIPVLNNIFNYYFFHLPMFFSLDFIHPFLTYHYGPMGINIAFVLILFVFPIWLKNFYQCSISKAFTVVLIVYGAHYLLTYQFLLSFSTEGYFSIYNPFKDSLPWVNIYSIGFTLLTIIIYPFFMRDYPKNKREFRQVALVYFILWGIIFFLSVSSHDLPSGCMDLPSNTIYKP